LYTIRMTNGDYALNVECTLNLVIVSRQLDTDMTVS
jgi:hypothetical protein